MGTKGGEEEAAGGEEGEEREVRRSIADNPPVVIPPPGDRRGRLEGLIPVVLVPVLSFWSGWALSNSIECLMGSPLGQ